MTKWEYKRVIISIQDFDKTMKRYGEEGWEAYQIFDGRSIRNTATEVYFKRPFLEVSEIQMLNE